LIRIAITAAAYEAMPPRCPFGSAADEAKRNADGQIFTWLERRALDRLSSQPAPTAPHFAQ
jgi:hypothetical protein